MCNADCAELFLFAVQSCHIVDLHTAQIQKQLLPAKSASDLVIFYYNVWKTRGTPRARAWWHAVEEVRGR